MPGTAQQHEAAACTALVRILARQAAREVMIRMTAEPTAFTNPGVP